MRAGEAVKIVNSTIFRPGWRWAARASRSMGDVIIVDFELDTVDTSHPSRGGGYTVPRLLAWDKVIDVSGVSGSDELLGMILQEVHETQEHEDREFLRSWDESTQSWVAPFHPHREEGKAIWRVVQALRLTRSLSRLSGREYAA
jgi:hypothetical protein